MATKLHGMLNLSKIPRELIGETKKGEKCIFIDIVPNKNGEDQYGNTHAVKIYNKETKESIFIGNLKPQEFEATGAKPTPAAPQTPGNSAETDDLPF